MSLIRRSHPDWLVHQKLIQLVITLGNAGLIDYRVGKVIAPRSPFPKFFFVLCSVAAELKTIDNRSVVTANGLRALVAPIDNE